MKLAITIAIDTAGKAKVIAGPNADVDGQIAALRELTNNGGKDGKLQYAEVAIVHTSKGVVKQRRFK